MNNITKPRREIALIGFICWLSGTGFSEILQAQQLLQVAQKKIEKTEDARGIKTVYISSEKADITVQGWAKPEIYVQVDLSARHTDRQSAARDLEKLHYVADRSGKSYHLRDFVLLDSRDKKPESNLKATYTVYVPSGCALDIKNGFGKVVLKGIRNSLKLNAAFCASLLENITGKAEVATSFGKLEGRAISGGLALASTRTTVSLTGLEGQARLQVSDGTLLIEPGNALSGLDIRANRSEVEMRAGEWQRFTYRVTGKGTRFRLPPDFSILEQAEAVRTGGYKGGATSVSVTAEAGLVSVR